MPGIFDPRSHKGFTLAEELLMYIGTELVSITGGGAGLATEATLLALLAKETQIEVDTATINLNVDTLEALGGTGNTNTAACATSLSVMDDWDESDRAKVNTIVGQAGVAAGAGAVSANTQRVVIATDDINLAAIKTSVELIDNAISGAGFNITQFGGAAVPIGAGLEAAAIRVTLPTDGTGKIATVSTVTAVTAITNALPAGENHLGSIGGNTTIVSSTTVMSVAGAYATGDYMGTTTTPQAFTNAVRVSGSTGVIKGITIQDNITTTNVAMELWLLSATFTAPTDNAAWAISDAESLTVQAIIPISTSNWFATANNQVYHDNAISIPFKCAATSLFYALVSRGTTPAFTSSDLTITLGILQD